MPQASSTQRGDGDSTIDDVLPPRRCAGANDRVFATVVQLGLAAAGMSMALHGVYNMVLGRGEAGGTFDGVWLRC